MNIRPPKVKENWDDIDWWTQCLLLGYQEVRCYEDYQELQILAQIPKVK